MVRHTHAEQLSGYLLQNLQPGLASHTHLANIIAAVAWRVL